MKTFSDVFGAAPAVLKLPGAQGPVALQGHGFTGEAEDGTVRLGAYGAWFGRLG